MIEKKKLSKILVLHYLKLVLRFAMFVAVLLSYVLNRTDILTQNAILPMIVWVFFIIGMLLRFFPSQYESMGCQKQFARNYKPIQGATQPINQSWIKTVMVALAWIGLNGVIALLYWIGIIDEGILILIALAFSVCDIICILFFCPFQTWFMQNRCCASCRIYNWDFAMMFTPLVLIPHWYTYSLLGCALVLLLRWEITFRIHPEWFSTATNQCLSCSNCQEKLCSHKSQLKRYLRKYKARFFSIGETQSKGE